MKRPSINWAIGLLLTISPALALPAAQAATLPVCPEVTSRVWTEGTGEMSSVCLNGKELISFRADSSTSAAEKAEDLAAKLQELLEDKKFNADDLLPAKNVTVASLQIDGNTVLSFDAASASDPGQSAVGLPLQSSWKMANSIRIAYGVPALPTSFLHLTEQSNSDSKPTKVGCFSGQASWYGPKFHGRKTSDGSRFDQEKLTAAHRSLPFGTKLLVMNRKTGHSCVVKINDRGPFVGDRIIDLSKGAARQLNMLSSGVAVVDCLVLSNEQ